MNRNKKCCTYIVYIPGPKIYECLYTIWRIWTKFHHGNLLHKFTWDLQTWRRPMTVSLGWSCGGHYRNIGYSEPFGPCNTKSILNTKSNTFSVGVGLGQVCPLSPILFVIFMNRISRHNGGEERTRLGISELRLFFLQMMWFCWPHRPVTFSMRWSSLQPNVKQLGGESAAPSLRSWFSCKKTELLPQNWGEVPASNKGVCTSGSCSRVNRK